MGTKLKIRYFTKIFVIESVSVTKPIPIDPAGHTLSNGGYRYPINPILDASRLQKLEKNINSMKYFI